MKHIRKSNQGKSVNSKSAKRIVILIPSTYPWSLALLVVLALSQIVWAESLESQSLDKRYVTTWDSTSQDHTGDGFAKRFNLGVLAAEVERTRLENNVEEGPSDLQIVGSEGKVSLELSVRSWQMLTVTYARREEKETSRVARSILRKFSTDTVSATLWYGGSEWESYVTSSYSLKKNKLFSRSDKVMYGYMLGGSYQPIDALSINPLVEFAREFDRSSDARSKTLYAYLGIEYAILKDLMTFSIAGSYTANKTSDGYNSQQFDGSIGLITNIGSAIGLPNDKATFSFKLNHSRNTDLNYQDADWQEHSMLFLFEIKP